MGWNSYRRSLSYLTKKLQDQCKRVKGRELFHRSPFFSDVCIAIFPSIFPIHSYHLTSDSVFFSLSYTISLFFCFVVDYSIQRLWHHAMDRAIIHHFSKTEPARHGRQRDSALLSATWAISMVNGPAWVQTGPIFSIISHRSNCGQHVGTAIKGTQSKVEEN